MSDPFIGQIVYFPWNWAPAGWLRCDGTIHQVQQYQALFTLITNTYGGDGWATFGVPDLRGRIAVGLGAAAGGGTNWTMGATNGMESVTLGIPNLPPHNHTLSIAVTSSTTGTATAGGMLGNIAPTQWWASPAATLNTTMNAGALGTAYTGGAHENRQPYVTLNACIAYEGVYPMTS